MPAGEMLARRQEFEAVFEQKLPSRVNRSRNGATQFHDRRHPPALWPYRLFRLAIQNCGRQWNCAFTLGPTSSSLAQLQRRDSKSARR
jgi:hypothetical protein